MDRATFAKLQAEVSGVLLSIQSVGDTVGDVRKEFQKLWTAVQSAQAACEDGNVSVKTASDAFDKAKAEGAASKASLQELLHLQSDMKAEVRWL